MKDNVIIAEFMGLPTEVFKSGKVNYYFRELNSVHKSWYEEHELSYNVSWDWLMPVIKKINEQISPNVRGLWGMITHPYEYHIEDVFSQVVEFIKEHNSKDFDWCNDSGFSDVFDNNLCECTAPQIDEDVCICGRPISNSEDRG